MKPGAGTGRVWQGWEGLERYQDRAQLLDKGRASACIDESQEVGLNQGGALEGGKQKR